jgi:hypothetical protein
VEQARGAQPAAVEAAARRLGLKPIETRANVFLPGPAAAERSDRP